MNDETKTGGRDHARYRRFAAAAVDGWILPDDAADLEAHLAACPSCRADQRAMVEDHALLATPSRVALPPDRVRASVLEAARAPRVPRVGSPERPWTALLAAGLIVVLVGAGVILASRPRSGPGVAPPTVRAAPCAPRPAGLVAWWPGNGDGRDAVGDHDIQPRGSLVFGPGLVGGALSLRSHGDFGEVPQAPELDVGTGDFTVHLWVRFADTVLEQVLIEDFRDTPPASQMAGWTLTKLADGVFRLHVATDDPGDLAIDTAPLATAGRWMHLAARRSGRTFAILVDGVVAAESVAAGRSPVDLDSAASILLGRRGDNREYFLRGELDEIQLVVGRAMSDAEIAAINAAGSGGTCPG